MRRKNVHVVPHKGRWATKTGGSSKVGRTYNLQSEAISNGRKQAIQSGSELLVHRPNGQIREKNSYGNDPKEIKG